MGAHGNGAIRDSGPDTAHTYYTYILHIHTTHMYPTFTHPIRVDAVGDLRVVIRRGTHWHAQGRPPRTPTYHYTLRAQLTERKGVVKSTTVCCVRK